MTTDLYGYHYSPDSTKGAQILCFQSIDKNTPQMYIEDFEQLCPDKTVVYNGMSITWDGSDISKSTCLKVSYQDRILVASGTFVIYVKPEILPNEGKEHACIPGSAITTLYTYIYPKPTFGLVCFATCGGSSNSAIFLPATGQQIENICVGSNKVPYEGGSLDIEWEGGLMNDIARSPFTVKYNGVELTLNDKSIISWALCSDMPPTFSCGGGDGGGGTDTGSGSGTSGKIVWIGLGGVLLIIAIAAIYLLAKRK